MKPWTTTLMNFGLVWAAIPVLAQGTFQNLGLESATLLPTPPGQFGGAVSSSGAIPGWTGFLGTNPVTQVLQNNLTLGAASIDILGPNWSFDSIIEGQYTVVLQPGADPFGSGQGVSASITQTGLIPINAASLQFKALTSSSFSISLGGQIQSLNALEVHTNYTLYGANIAPLAGQVETLTVTALAGPGGAPSYFDSFNFSPGSVPEPSAIGLIAVGLSFAFSRFNARQWKSSRDS